MKSYSLLTALAVAGFLSFGAAYAQTYTLNFKLTLQAQDMWQEQVGNSQVLKSTVVKVKVTNKDILNLLGVSYSSDFTGDTLTLHSGHFQIRDSTGAVVRDATSGGVMGNFDLAKTDYVYQETINHSKDTYIGTGYCISMIGYADLLGNEFSIRGMVQDTMKHSGGNTTASFKFSGAGTGEILSPPDGASAMPVVIFTGTLDGKSQ